MCLTTLARARRIVSEHRRFAAVAAAAAALRCAVILGYPPAMFFSDSYNYITDAVTRAPDIVRSDGYPLFLYLLLPVRSLALVTALQALMGLAIGTGIYAVLRRRGLPWWGATLAALPVLFDAFELQLEHMVAADTLFALLVVAALILLCWWDRPPLPASAAAGLLIGYAATVRTVGEPLLVIAVAGMAVRRIGWRRAAATAAAGVAPVAGYMIWFHAHYGHYGLTESTGTFLYSRVSSFAECARMDPPADLRVLCDPRPPGARPGSQEYLWSNQTPLARLTGDNNVYRFTPRIEALTSAFAERAVLAQPLDYARVVIRDTLRTFGWARPQSNLEGSGPLFRFGTAAAPVPRWVTTGAVNDMAAQRYGGRALGRPAVRQPWAGFLVAYQRYVYLRGPFLFLAVLAGAAGVLASARRARPGRGGLCLLPWLTGLALIVLPPATAGFSYRYVLAAVPPACLAAGLAFAGPGGLPGWLREHGMVPRGR